MRKLLAAFAHPDDESFGTGGTLAYYSHHDCEVHLICGTKGEVGEVDPSLLEGYKSIGELREHELCCASKFLNLSNVIFLGYRDSGMAGSVENHHPNALAAQPVEKVARQIAHIIRELKPDVVLTFDPNGGYKHPDHIAIHNATVLAFELAGDGKQFIDGLEEFKPQKLFFSTFPNIFLKLLVRIVKVFGGDPAHWGKNKDIDLESIVKESFPVHTKINYRSVLRERDSAAKCHASQGGGAMNRGFFNWWRNTFSPYETFMQAYPPKRDKKVNHDFFE